MTMSIAIPVLPAQIYGQTVHVVDARALHRVLDVRRDFSNWIKRRIAEFEFEEGSNFIVVPPQPRPEFSPNLAKNARPKGRPSIDYYLTLDMAKELAMVERTPRGRQARRYFIECERRLRQLQQTPLLPDASSVSTVALPRATRQAINRQAWADVAGQTYRTFHERREQLMRQEATRLTQQVPSPAANSLPVAFRPKWAR